MRSRRTFVGSLLVVVAGLFLAPFGFANPSQPKPPAFQAPDTLTFFVSSDLHYGWPLNASNLLQRHFILRMNATPGVSYPPAVGGTVAAPRGVLLLGDLIQDGRAGNLNNFENDWFVPGKKLARFPVYEGLGNHDVRDKESWTRLRERVKAKPGLNSVSTNGFHYSWTWDGVHFVMLNISPAIRGALPFLASDLRAHAGRDGKPVILLQHYPVVAGERWAEADLDAFFEVIKPYNVVCLMHGHTHSAKTYKVRGLDVIDDGSLKSNNRPEFHPGFLVVRIEGNKLTAIQHKLNGTWGKMILEKTFFRSAPASIATETAQAKTHEASRP